MPRKALVLGGTGGIGTAIVEDLKSRFGDTVVSAGHRECDLTDFATIDAFLDREHRDFDVVVQCSGINPTGPYESFSDDELDRVMRINCSGFLHIMRELKPYWERARCGHVVVISSIYGIISRSGRLPYSTAKHALLGAMKALAIELAPLGVMVNAVSPGFIETTLTSRNNSPETIAGLIRGIPAGRLGKPEDVARAVSMLASPENTYIAGHNLVVDGAYSVGGFQRR